MNKVWIFIFVLFHFSFLYGKVAVVESAKGEKKTCFDIYQAVASLEKHSGTIVLEKNRYELDREIVFPMESQVVIEKGSRFLFRENSGFIIEGSFKAVGDKKNPVVFSGEKNQFWKGIQIKENSGICKLKHCVIENALAGIESSVDTLIIDSCTLENNMIGLVAVAGNENCKILNSSFNNNHYGVWVQDIDSKVEIKKCRFIQNMENKKNTTGINLLKTSGVNLINNVILGCDNGLLIHGSGIVTVYDNLICYNGNGISAKKNITISFEKNCIMYNDYNGIEMLNSNDLEYIIGNSIWINGRLGGNDISFEEGPDFYLDNSNWLGFYPRISENIIFEQQNQEDLFYYPGGVYELPAWYVQKEEENDIHNQKDMCSVTNKANHHRKDCSKKNIDQDNREMKSDLFYQWSLALRVENFKEAMNIYDLFQKSYPDDPIHTYMKKKMDWELESLEDDRDEKDIIIDLYPNPVNDKLNLVSRLSAEGKGKIDIFNIEGRKIKTVFSGYFPKGISKFKWNCENDDGQKVGSGVYLIRIQKDKQEKIKKITIMK